MKKYILILMALVLGQELFATISSATYSFSQSSGSLITATGTRTRRLNGGGDNPTSVLSLPFNFTFDGTSHSQYSISPDGWIELGGSGSTAQSTNDLGSTTNTPKIAPFWDDLDFSSGEDNNNGGAYTFVNGTAPNRVFVIEWKIKVPKNGNSGNGTVQLALYETTNNFTFIYNGLNPSGSTYSSYSVGFSNKTGATNNQASITVASTASISYAGVNNANNAKITDGTIYSFTSGSMSASSNLVFSNLALTSMTVGFTSGSGSNHIVLCQTGSAVTAMPTNLTNYTANTTYGSGSQIGSAYVVYNGTGNSFSLTNLSQNTNYYFRVVEQTGTGSAATFFTSSTLNGDHGTLAPAPSAPPAAAATPPVCSSHSVNFKVQKGDGNRRIVVCQKDNDLSTDAEQGHSYSASSRFGDGERYENGYVVYDGPDDNITVDNLEGGSHYKFMVVEYNGTGTSSTYANDKKYKCENVTNATPPTTGTSSATFGTVKSDQMEFSFTKGDGAKRIVVCKKGSAPNCNGGDGRTYAADSTFGNGDTCGDGYVVYNGTGSSCRVKHLDDNSEYHFAVIEYNGDNDKTSYDNDHKYRCNASTPRTDTDNDGVADIDDAYPTDDKRAYNNNYPAAGYGTLMYEDLWPAKGDYDFNDLVIDYRFNTITNASNQVVEVVYSLVTRASGGSLHNGFAFQLDGINPNKITSVSGSKASGASWISLSGNGTEAGQSNNANILVFDDVYKLFTGNNGGFSFINTDPNAPNLGTDTTNLTVRFLVNGVAPSGGSISFSDFNTSLFNPYMIVGQDRGKEVHLLNRTPSAKVNNAYFGQDQDRSNPDQNKYYLTENNLPWALNVSSSIPYAKEKMEFSTAYTKFIDWAQSGGTRFTDWYSNTSYRDNSKLIIR